MMNVQGQASNSVIVLGGGPAGLSAALALAQGGFAVRLIDAGPDAAEDRRTSALMLASVIMLERLGVWAECRSAAAPLERLRIVDDTGRLLRAPTVEFSAAEIGEEAFGWNVPNSVLVAALRRRCAQAANVAPFTTRAESIELETDQVLVCLADGTQISAPLLVAADGRHSPSRSAAGIRVDQWDYDQAAIVLNFRHQRPHGHVSTEFHRPSGPFTLVPLPGDRSSLVWVEERRMAAAYGGFGRDALSREIERLSHRILGAVEIDTEPAIIPLSGLKARRFAARRVALVGEAAHLMPPIGAQGLNLGLRDGAMIAEIAADAAENGEDIGDNDVMERYDRARGFDVMSRSRAVDLLNRSLLSDFVPLQALRAAGLSALAGIGPLRRYFMREGVAPHSGLPRLMRRDGTVHGNRLVGSNSLETR